jgi:hypothetical protein
MTLPVRAPQLRFPHVWRTGLLGLVVLSLVLATSGRASAAPNTITQPDIGGQFTSLKLDGTGNPVISHYDPVSRNMRLVYCADASCSATSTVTAPDPTGLDEQPYDATTSLALTAANVPVISYLDYRELKLVHCGDAACSSPTIRTIDSSWPPDHLVGIWNDIALNGDGNPVIGYYQQPTDTAKITNCADATCASWLPYYVDESSGSVRGPYVSMLLDGSGLPVMSYYDQSQTNLMLARCHNATCSSRTITTVDGASPAIQAGKYTSLTLDASGYPVISYYNESAGDLRVVHCGDVTCTSGNTIASPDVNGNVGQHTSIVLDATGHPIVSYYSVTASALKILYCGDANCTAGNSIITPDSAGTVGQYTSLVLDTEGSPVVSYYDASDSKLNVLHCGDPLCVGGAEPVGGLTELPLLDVAADGESSLAWWIAGTCAVTIVAAAALRVRARR